MGANWVNPTKRILLCHYDVQPYRDAFHGRNSPCFLLCNSVLILLIITILSALVYGSQSNDTRLPDNLVYDIIALFTLNRTTILTDMKAIYPTDLELFISRTHITANQPFPICIAAPKFLLPLIRSTVAEDVITEETITSIDDIKKAHDNIEDTLFKEPKDWLKTSFFKDSTQAQYEEDEILDIRVEEIWHSLIGYSLDPNCFIRIDASSTKIVNQLQSTGADASSYHDVICSNQGQSVMKPSFIVINPDNGVIYQLNVASMYYGNGECVSYQNVFSYDPLNKKKLDELLSEEREEIQQFFADLNQHLNYALVIMMVVVCAVYLAWIGYFFGSMWIEGLIATFAVWIIMLLLKCSGALREFSNIRPTFKEIWRLNQLLCVPDFSLVRIMQLTSISFYGRIIARTVITLLLLIDIYQNDPPHDKES